MGESGRQRRRVGGGRNRRGTWSTSKQVLEAAVVGTADDDDSDSGDDDDGNDNEDNDNYSEGARKQKTETSTDSVPPPCKADLLHRGG